MNAKRLFKSGPCKPGLPFTVSLLVLLSFPSGQVRAQRSPADSAAFLIQAGRHAYEQGSLEGLQHSIRLFQLALPQLRISRDLGQEGNALNNIGAAYRNLGRLDSALVYYARALTVRREMQDRHGEGATLNNIGAAYWASGYADSALIYYMRALPILREVGDRRGESAMLNNVGAVYSDLSHADSAFLYFTHALAIQRATGDRAGEGNTLINLGSVQQDLSRPDSALNYYRQALVIVREVGNRRREALTLNAIGTVYGELGHADSAMAYFLSALPIQREVADRPGEAATLVNLGAIHQEQGRPDSALVYFALALPIQRSVMDRRAEAATLNHMGGLHSQLGHADSALAYYARSLTIAREVRNQIGESYTLNNIGSVHQDLGRLDSALVYYLQALSIQRVIGDSRAEANSLQGIGLIYRELGRVDSALVYDASALAIQRRVGDRHGEGTTLSNIGLINADLGRTDSALVYYASALALQRQTGDLPGEGATLSNVGSAYKDLGQPDSALVYYARALAIIREVKYRSGESTLLSNIGAVYNLTPSHRDLVRAVAYFDSAAAVVREMGRTAGGDQNRLSYAEESVNLFQQWALAWLARAQEVGEGNAASAAFAASERGRAQTLRDLMHGNAAGALAAAGAGTASTGPGADLPAEGRTLASSLARSGVPAISYLVTRDTLLAFLVVPGREVEVFRVAVREDTLAALVGAVRASLGVDLTDSRVPARQVSEDSDAWNLPAARLAALLLPAGLRTRLPARGELVIVPAGPLYLLPFAVLPLSQGAQKPDSTSSLGLRYAIRYAPSLQVLVDMEARPGRSRSTADALVVGNPSMPRIPDDDGAFFVPSRLPGAETEARWVADYLSARMLTGGEATEAVVRTRLGSATLIHLATHAEVYASDARARDSYIALAPGGGYDGTLTVGEVLDDTPGMSAELVVLSACQTGLGNLKKAEGTVGLQWVFLARGAQGLLVSLWSVEDGSPLLLMQRFYTHWRGGAARAEALRRAEEEVAARFPHPRYWAAFQMVGAR